jgi:hypothetical protein
MARRKKSERGRKAKKGRSERFYKQETTYRYRNTKTGRYTKRKGKHVRKEKVLTLFTADTRTGEIRKYGSVRVPSRKTVAEIKTKGSNTFIKSALRNSKSWRGLGKLAAKGVRVTLRGKRKNKAEMVRVDVIFDRDKLRDKDYLMRVTLAKVLARLGARALRLSDENITSHKNYKQLSDVTLKIEAFDPSVDPGEFEDEGDGDE